MARLAVLASGNGSNFQALVEALRAGKTLGASAAHECVLLIHDRKAAFAAERAARLGVPSRHVGYAGRSREDAEEEIDSALRESRVDLVALAGFMRILSPAFVAAWMGRLVNIHPSLLPAWPGAASIHRAYAAGERRFGASVHFVDEGMDTGPVIAQDEFQRDPDESEEAVERRLHSLEHRLYPSVVIGILDRIDSERRIS